MKTPRVDAFDPKAPTLKSPLDGMPPIAPAQKQGGLGEALPEHMPVPPPVAPGVRPFTRSPERRNIVRGSFEIFQDQLDSLREIALGEKMCGEKGSMSEMVREAIDTQITKKRNQGF